VPFLMMVDQAEVHPAVGWLLLAAAILLALATVYRVGVRPIVQVGLEVRELLRDLRGYPGRPGHPAVPGLVERVGVNTSKLDSLAGSLEEHLVWSRQTTDHLAQLVDDHLVAAEVTRQEGHREATHLWDAIGEIAKHGGLTIERPTDARTRRGDRDHPTEETP
jgi:hypothetical protein